MQQRFSSLLLLIFCLAIAASGKPANRLCLPAGVKASDIVTAKLISSGPAGPVIEKVTVKQELRRLKAHCKRGRLVDNAGKTIRFYRLKIAPGCQGIQPPDFAERLAKQQQEIAALSRRNHVIELTCNPSGIPRP